MSPEPRKEEGVSKRYENEQIVVHWEPKYCIHAGFCYRGLPDVFKPRERPWVDVEAAAADEIANVVSQCPTGALSFERKDGGPNEELQEETSISPQPDGPLYLRGDLRIYDEEGTLIRKATRVALCRCGHSANKPFCDNSHVRVRFSSKPSTLPTSG